MIGEGVLKSDTPSSIRAMTIGCHMIHMRSSQARTMLSLLQT
jgi:hypothetical protein